MNQLLKIKGFTLMELLIYVGIFAIAAGLFTGVLFTILKVQQRESSSTEVNQQLNFVMQTIQRVIKDSSAVIVNSTSTDVDNDGQIGFSQNRLVLRVKDSGSNPVTDRDPIVIWKDDASNAIKMSEGIAPNQKISDLTNSRVIADKLEFTKFTQYPGHDTVSVDMQLTQNTDNPQEKVSRSLRSAIARVSAATFDSDILPGGSYNYNLGQAGSPWKVLYMSDGSVSNPSYTFSNDTTLGLFKVNGSGTIGFVTQGLERMRIDQNGNVGIGTTALDGKLSVAGEILAGSGADKTVFNKGNLILISCGYTFTPHLGGWAEYTWASGDCGSPAKLPFGYTNCMRAVSGNDWAVGDRLIYCNTDKLRIFQSAGNNAYARCDYLCWD